MNAATPRIGARLPLTKKEAAERISRVFKRLRVVPKMMPPHKRGHASSPREACP